MPVRPRQSPAWNLLQVAVALGLGGFSPAAAACDDPSILIASTERAVVAGRLEAVPDLVARTEQAFACGGEAVQRPLLGRWYRVQAAWFALSDAPEEAALAWRSAELAAPGAWTEALGPTLEQERNAAVAAPPAYGTGTIGFNPPPVGHRMFLDGIETPFPVSTPPGLHLVQLLDPAGAGAVYARQVFLLDAGELFELDPGPLPAPGSASARGAAPPPPAVAGPKSNDAARGPRWTFWGGLGAGALAGVAAGLARAQRTDMREARDLAELDAAHGRQKVYGACAYGLAGAAVIGVSIGLGR